MLPLRTQAENPMKNPRMCFRKRERKAGAVTKKKAIEAIGGLADGANGEHLAAELRIVAEAAFDLGRVAGMREAAKIAKEHDGEWLPVGVQSHLRRVAGRLSRKLRDERTK
jgi:hypothetical protein